MNTFTNDVGSVTYDRYSLSINGRRVLIRSGAMHYFRLPGKEMWRDRLFKLKAAGYNTVDLYFYWGFHSSAPGVYDFEGIRDVAELLKITQELGLLVIARPGPYINAETSGGGFPGWLLAKRELPLRNRNIGEFVWSDTYMNYVREWWEQIVPLINASPNVILFQIENEYATADMEPDTMQALYKMARELGVQAPIFHNDLYVAGLYEDVVDIYSFDNYSVTHFEHNWRDTPAVFDVLDGIEETLREFCVDRPIMVAELQAGWYGGWKLDTYERINRVLGREHIAVTTRSLIGQGLTLYNHYLAIGCTNWNRMGSTEAYSSYDFAAPIAETGLPTERFYAAKALNQFLGSFDLTATKRIDNSESPIQGANLVYTVRKLVHQPENTNLVASWVFLRNLTWQLETVTLQTDRNHQIPVLVHPHEVLILPGNIPLQCGYVLDLVTAEPIYQSENLLVIRADRPTFLELSGENLPANVSITISDGETQVKTLAEPDRFELSCPQLSERDYRLTRLGTLNILLLGTALADRLWIEDESQPNEPAVVFGPDMKTTQGYAYQHPEQKAYRLIPQEGRIESLPIARQVELPEFSQPEWIVSHNAPELLPDLRQQNAADFRFQPVSADGADLDKNGIYEGSAWYRLMLPTSNPSTETTLDIDARHHWVAYLNGEWLGHGGHPIVSPGQEAPPPTRLKINRDKAGGELLLYVTGLGHPKGFHDDGQTPQGLLSLCLNGVDVTADTEILPHTHTERLFSSSQTNKKPIWQGNQPSHSSIISIEASFALPDIENAYIPWGLVLGESDTRLPSEIPILEMADVEWPFERTEILLNGHPIARDWLAGRRQNRFYLPEGLLYKNRPNTLTLIAMNFSQPLSLDELRNNLPPLILAPYAVLSVVSE